MIEEMLALADQAYVTRQFRGEAQALTERLAVDIPKYKT